MNRYLVILLSLLFLSTNLYAQEIEDQEGASTKEEVMLEETKNAPIESYLIFDDEAILNRYTKKYSELSKEIILALIKEDNLTAYKSAAAIRVFKLRDAKEIVGKDKKIVEKILLRRVNRSDSPFVQVEIMHTLCIMDRYKYYKSMIPALIKKLDHYNVTINLMAYDALNDLIDSGNNRTREARLVFTTLRKILFLSRKRLANITEPDEKLSQKLVLLRWSIKVLGRQELNKLPKEVLNLL